MAALLQPVNGYVLRWGPGLRGKGDPFEFTVCVEIEGDTAHLFAGSGHFTAEGWREIKQTLTSMGVKRALWERHNGRHRHVEILA